MRTRLAVLAVALGGVAVAGCTPSLPFISKPAAQLDGHDISMSDYEARLALLKALYNVQGQSAATPPPSLDSPAGRQAELGLEDKAIHDLVDEQIIRDEAQKQGVSVTDDEVQQALDNARRDRQSQVDKAKQQGQTLPGFEEYIKTFGYSLSSFRDQLRDRITEQKLENKMAQVRVDQAIESLKSGTAFDAVARKWSDDPTSAGRGGQVTLKPDDLNNMDQLVKPALELLQPGETSSQPARGVNGFYLFKVVSRDANGTTVDVVYINAPNLAYYRTGQRPQWFTDFLTAREQARHLKYNVGSHTS